MSEGSRGLFVERTDELWRSGTRRSFLKLLGLGGTMTVVTTRMDRVSARAKPALVPV